jgi:oligoribonuclease
MKFVSIDIEGTGLDTERDQVLQIGAVFDDTSYWRGPSFKSIEDLPKFKVTILHDRIEGQVGGIHLNAGIFEKINQFNGLKSGSQDYVDFVNANGEFMKPKKAVEFFHQFLCDTHFSDSTQPVVINVAGKNFGTYDRPMLKRLPDWDKHVVMRQRMLDPAMLFWDPYSDDSLPNLSRCLSLSGYKHIVSHDALDDALDVVRVLRHAYAEG